MFLGEQKGLPFLISFFQGSINVSMYLFNRPTIIILISNNTSKIFVLHIMLYGLSLL
jgi:hypothetical protein